MQRTRARLSVFLIIITVIAACALRFFQLFKLTDSDTGLVTGSSGTSLIIYSLLALTLGFAVIYAGFDDIKVKTFDFENKNKKILMASFLLMLGFFVDYIHQCYNCCIYFDSVSYVEYTYVIPLIISGLLALMSSFYIFTFMLTVKSSGYDFRNFTVLHFLPLAWGFSRLCVIMTKIVYALSGIESIIELGTLIFSMCFWLNFISAVDKQNFAAAKTFVFSSIMLMAFSTVLVVPRALMIITGNASLLYEKDFTSTAYIMSGIFACVLTLDINKRNNAIKEN